MLVNRKLHLPHEKQGIVDRNEDVDEMMFDAHHVLQAYVKSSLVLRVPRNGINLLTLPRTVIYIHRPLSRLHHSPLEYTRHCMPMHFLSPPTNPQEFSLWIHTKKVLEAAPIAASLHTLPCPIIKHSPLTNCGLSLFALANLSACAYLVEGEEWFRMRERVWLSLGMLKGFGGTWALSRRTASEAKGKARSVFSEVRVDPSMEIESEMRVMGEIGV